MTLTDGRTLEQVSAPIRGEDGTPYGRVWAYRDLTQQRRLANAHADLLLEQAAREAASQRSARLRALHEAALTMHAVMEAEPGSIVVLLAEIMRRAVAALYGRDGRIVLTEDAAWRDLTPGERPGGGPDPARPHRPPAPAPGAPRGLDGARPAHRRGGADPRHPGRPRSPSAPTPSWPGTGSAAWCTSPCASRGG